MISGRRIDFVTISATALLSMMLTGLAGAVTTEKVESIVRGIVTPRDTPIVFVERRTNRLLAEPMTVNGEIIFTFSRLCMATFFDYH